VTAYAKAAAGDRVAADYPLGPAFLERFAGMPGERLRDLQERRFRDVVAAAWATPFYRRLWVAHGVARGDVRGLADLAHLPIVDKAAIVADVAEHPPFGSLARRDDGGPAAQVLQTTSGTTGDPQPVLWGAWGREVQNALLGRVYRWVGVDAGDVVHSVYGHGPVNGGHYVREALARWTDALVLTAGTGLETRSDRQVALMVRFRVTVLAGFADYLRRLADLARDAGLVPGEDIPVRLIVGHLPAGDRGALEAAWGGARALDWYGVADTGVVSAEGPDRDGHHLFEDANVVEVLDPDTHRPVPDGADGVMVVTSLGKSDVAPLVRFDTHDVTRVLPGRGTSDLPFRRTAGLVGRSDQMVKLRGINVYPTAVAALLTALPGATGEYVCRLERRADGADHLVVIAESTEAGAAPGPLDERLAESLSAALGIRVGAEVVPPGATAGATGVAERQKPLRLVDVRP
jgi:phenylacetate-CoA ligase